MQTRMCIASSYNAYKQLLTCLSATTAAACSGVNLHCAIPFEIAMPLLLFSLLALARYSALRAAHSNNSVQELATIVLVQVRRVHMLCIAVLVQVVDQRTAVCNTLGHR
jgi:hypothetical protein